jgi:hypothetical protein
MVTLGDRDFEKSGHPKPWVEGILFFINCVPSSLRSLESNGAVV